MTPDAAYSLTRKKGEPVTVVQIHGAATVDHKSGIVDEDRTETVVRNVVKEPTSYARIVRAQAVQQDVGETTFIFWMGDPEMLQIFPNLQDGERPRLDSEDYIIAEGVKHKVVSSSVEDKTSLVVTATEVVGEGNDPLTGIPPI